MIKLLNETIMQTQEELKSAQLSIARYTPNHFSAARMFYELHIESFVQLISETL